MASRIIVSIVVSFLKFVNQFSLSFVQNRSMMTPLVFSVISILTALKGIFVRFIVAVIISFVNITSGNITSWLLGKLFFTAFSNDFTIALIIVIFNIIIPPGPAYIICSRRMTSPLRQYLNRLNVLNKLIFLSSYSY